MIKKAMIMAAGVGSRLDPLTQKKPKPLIPIANQPVMDLLLKHLYSFGIKEAIANTHFLAEDIHHKYKIFNDTGVSCNFVNEDKLSGTAGGVKKCEWFFDETFVVMSGDGLTCANLAEMYASHKKSGAIATIGLTRVPREEIPHFGVVVADENSKVIEFQEKPSLEEAKSDLINTGIYIFETKIFNYIPENTFYDFAKNVFPSLIVNNEVINSHIIEDYWSDIGTLNQYRLSTADVLQGKTSLSIPYPENSIGWCAKTSSVDLANVKDGKIVVGEGSIIEKNTQFEGYSVIGNNCIVKEGAVIKNCILWDNVIIENNVQMEDCIIAGNTVIQKNLQVEKGSVIGADRIISHESEVITTV